VIVTLITDRDTKRNSLVFTTLAFLFKYLSKYMLNDLPNWFKKYSKLIGHKKWYIRNFAAESFSFLINKLSEESELPQYIDNTFESLSRRPTQDMFDGTSQLFFETMKSVYGHFHSRMPVTLNLLFRKMDWSSLPDKRMSNFQKKAELERRFTLMQKLTQLLTEHTRNKEVSENLWIVYTAEIQHLISKWNKQQQQKRNNDTVSAVALGTQIGHIVALVTMMITSEKAASSYLAQILNSITDKTFLHSKLPEVALSSIFKFIQTTIAQSTHRKLLKNLPETLFNILSMEKSEALLLFFKDVLEVLYGSEDSNEEQTKLFNQIMQYVTKHFDEDVDTTLSFLLTFVEGIGKEKSESLNLQCDPLLNKIISVINKEYKKIESVKKKLSQYVTVDTSNVESPFNVTRLWASLKCISNFKISEQVFGETKVMNLLVNMFKLFRDSLVSIEQNARAETVALTADTLFCLTMISNLSVDSFKVMHKLFDSVISFLQKYPSNVHTVRAVDLYLNVYSKGELLPNKFLLDTYSQLAPNLHSRSSEMRLYTLQLLNRFTPSELTVTTTNGQYNGGCNILSLLKNSESRGIDWELSRQKLYELDCVLQEIQRYRNRIPQLYYTLLAHYVFGALFIKFSMVWPPVQEIAKALISFKFSLFWDVFYPILEEIYLEAHYESSNVDSDEATPYIYKKEVVLKMPFVKFENYNKTFSTRSLNHLETMFSKEFDESSDPEKYTELKTYLQMLWGFFGEATRASVERSADVCKFFTIFYEKQLASTSNQAILFMNEQFASNMAILLDQIRKVPYDYLTDANNVETCHKILTLVKNILPTSTLNIQNLAIDCMAAFRLPWLQPYVDNLHELVNVRHNTKYLNSLPLEQIEPRHRSQLIPVIIQILEPSLMKYDLMKKLKKANRNAEKGKWQMRITEVHRYLAWMKPDEVVVYLKSIFWRILNVVENKNNQSILGIDIDASIRNTKVASLSHLLSIFQAMIVAEGNFVPLLDQILDFTLRIVKAIYEIQNSSMDIEEEEEKEVKQEAEAEEDDGEKKESDSSSLSNSTEKRKIRDLEQEAIDSLVNFFNRYTSYSYTSGFLDSINELITWRFNQFEQTKTVEQFPRIFRVPFEWFKHSSYGTFIARYHLLERLIQLMSFDNISSASFSAILDLLSDVLQNKKEEVPKDRSTVGSIVLKPITDLLLTSVYNLLQRDEELKKQHENKCFVIIDQLSEYFTDESPAEIILYFYGRSFKNGRITGKHADKVLTLFSRYLSLTTRETRTKYIKIFSTLFLTQTNESYRKSMCDIIKNSDEKSMKLTSDIIYGLNCYTATRLDRIDYSVRIDTFTKIIEGDAKNLSQLNELQLYPIVANLLYYMNDEQWNIRDNAAKSLQAVVRMIGKNKQKKESCEELIPLITVNVKRGATSDKIQKSNDYLPVLAEFVLFDEFKNLQPFKKTLVELSDSSVDEKLKGLKSFITTVFEQESVELKSSIDQDIVYTIFVPMFCHLILSEDKKVSKQSENNLIKLTPRMNWKYGEKMMNNFINMLSLASKGRETEKKRKIVLRIICGVLEKYPLLEDDKPQEQPNDNDDEDVEMTEVSTSESSNDQEQIRKYFIRTIVPMLQSHLWDQKGEISVMKVNIAFLLIKILKKCSNDLLRRELSKVILGLIGKLKTKYKEQQSECQQALIDILKELGSEYFHFTLQKLVDSLKLGYEIDVLYSTTFALLKTVQNKMKNWKIDGAVNLVLDILLADITRPAALEHNKKKGHKYETAQDQKNNADFHKHNQTILFSSFEILAHIVSFDKSIDKIVQRLDSVLEKQYNTEILARFEGIFDHLLKGLAKNPTITSDKLSQFVLQIVDQKGIHKKTFVQSQKQVHSKYQSSKALIKDPREYFMVLPEPGRHGAIESNSDQSKLDKLSGQNNGYYLVQFALSLIDNGLRTQQVKDIAALDPLVPKLIQYLSSGTGKQLKLALTSLKVLITLQKHATKSVASTKRQEILNGVVELMLNTGVDTANDTWDTLFTAIKFFLDDNTSKKKKAAQLSEKQLDVLLDMLKIDIFNSKQYNVKPFQLLQTLVEKKVMVPQIYDMMEKLKSVMLKLTDNTIQQHVINTLTVFYLYYPFTPEVLQEHLNFMFKNVINEHIPYEGKLALIKMIQAIVSQFPVELLNDKVEFIFCPLILQLANERKENSAVDSETKADALIVDAIYTFLKKLNEESFRDKVMSMICKWLKAKKLRSVAIHACAIAARVSNGSKLKTSNTIDSDIWPAIKSVIQTQSDKNSTKRADLMLLRSCLLTIQELISHDILSNQLLETIWEPLNSIIQHTASHQVLAAGLNVINLQLTRNKQQKKNKVINDVNQLSNVLDRCHTVFQRRDFQVVEDVDSLTASLIKVVIAAIEDILYLVNTKAISSDQGHTALERFFKQIKKCSTQSPKQGERNASLAIQKTMLLKLFAVITKKFNQQVSQYVNCMTPLLFYCTEDDSVNRNIVTPQVTELANQVKSEMKNLFNYEFFMKTYEEGKFSVIDTVKRVKEQKDRFQVTNPVLAAQQSLEKSKDKKIQKKRKRQQETEPQQQSSSSSNKKQRVK
jgi:U3 small nucleolar RNA-associated protein 20